MCFPVYDCFFCISLEVGCKIIGIVYTILSVGLTILFGVPVTLAWGALPPSRAFFYAIMVACTLALFASSCLLVMASFKNKPSLMRPWVTTAWSTGVPLMLACVVGMVTMPLRFLDADLAAEESCVISVYFVHGLLLFYFSSVVNSRRHELELQEKDKAIEVLIFPTIHNQYRDHLL